MVSRKRKKLTVSRKKTKIFSSPLTVKDTTPLRPPHKGFLDCIYREASFCVSTVALVTLASSTRNIYYIVPRLLTVFRYLGPSLDPREDLSWREHQAREAVATWGVIIGKRLVTFCCYSNGQFILKFSDGIILAFRFCCCDLEIKVQVVSCGVILSLALHVSSSPAVQYSRLFLPSCMKLFPQLVIAIETVNVTKIFFCDWAKKNLAVSQITQRGKVIELLS